MKTDKNILLNSLTVNMEKDQKEIKFAGFISSIELDCFREGNCKFKVDNKWILVDGGKSMANEKAGKLIGIKLSAKTGTMDIYLNKEAEVYAAKVPMFAHTKENGWRESWSGDSEFTLYGDTKYYIKLLTSR